MNRYWIVVWYESRQAQFTLRRDALTLEEAVKDLPPDAELVAAGLLRKEIE